MKKRQEEQFDVVIIGSGSAGLAVAEGLSVHGIRIAIIEKGKWGGECPNHACIPLKALLRNARAYKEAFSLQDFGVHVGSITYNYADMMRRKNAVVKTVTGRGKRFIELFAELGVEAISGEAVFIDAHRLQVGKRIVKAKAIVIATGSTDRIPPIDGLAKTPFWTYGDAMNAKQKPKSIVIIGGGPVGCEFATFYSLLDTNVTVLERGPHILGREDSEISVLAQKELVDNGATVHTDAKVLSVTKRLGKFLVTYQVKDQERVEMTAERVLVTAGKRSNVDALLPAEAGLQVNEQGGLDVKETLQSEVDHIFVVGDASGGMLFTHMAHHEGEVAAWNIAKYLGITSGRERRRETAVIPHVTFVDPELASVGLTAEAAKQAGKSVRIGRFPIGALGRSVTDDDRRGMVKVIIDDKTEHLLGVHMQGAHAGDVIHEAAIAMQAGLTARDVLETIHAFPTYSEALVAAIADALYDDN